MEARYQVMTSDSSHRAFTLLEILLVVLVVSIAAAAFLPVALNTVDQSRTRAALRETIALNRYARNRAVLDQRPVAVLYPLYERTMQMIALSPDPHPDPGLALRDELSGYSDAETGVELIRTRQLPQGVRIRRVEGARREGDTYFVIYNPNGTTDTHELELVDPQDNAHRIQVNGLTGVPALAN